MIQICTATAEETDFVWQALLFVPDRIWRPVEIHQAGVPLYVVTRQPDGEQTSIRPEAPAAPAHQVSAA
jgi:hypothetical protein